MDALTHAVEAFVGQWATDYTDRMALAAVGMIYENLRIAYRNGEEPRGARADGARGDLRGPRVHAGQRRLRPRHRAPAGRQVPHAARPRQRDHAAARAARSCAPRSRSGWRVLAVRAKVGKEGERPAALAKKFLDSVEALNRDLGIPAQLDALREEDIPALAKAACWEADTNYPVPRYMSPETCEELLRQVLPRRRRRSLPAGAARADPVAERVGGSEGLVPSGAPCQSMS